MTDIPGTITTAIREAIDAAVLAERMRERDRCARIADDCFKRGIWPGEIEAEIRAITVEPEPEGQHFDISAGTFVSNTRG